MATNDMESVCIDPTIGPAKFWSPGKSRTTEQATCLRGILDFGGNLGTVIWESETEMEPIHCDGSRRTELQNLAGKLLGSIQTDTKSFWAILSNLIFFCLIRSFWEFGAWYQTVEVKVPFILLMSIIINQEILPEQRVQSMTYIHSPKTVPILSHWLQFGSKNPDSSTGVIITEAVWKS